MRERVAGLIVTAVYFGVLGWVVGVGHGQRQRPLATLQAPHIPPPHNYAQEKAMICLSQVGPAQISDLYVNVAGKDTYGFAANELGRKIVCPAVGPPRCRAVPDGAGCIDWFEPSETGQNWGEVLKRERAKRGIDPRLRGH